MTSISQTADPDIGLVEQLLSESLRRSPAFIKDSINAEVKLDQNEAFSDWPLDIKQAILQQVANRPWNRYPEPYCVELKKAVADHVGVGLNNVLLGPGSNYLLTVLINAFCRNSSTNVVARPSFPLYESHLRYEGIPYQTWNLSADLEYEPGLLHDLPEYAVVLFASPNNPVGNSLPATDLEELLGAHPTTLFVADEAYCEFGGQSFVSLLDQFPNLLIVRTLSKTMASAALRLGYVLGSRRWIEHLEKLVLPFLINPLTELAVQTVLQNHELQGKLKETVLTVIREREAMLPTLLLLGQRYGFRVRPTQANFFLLRCESQDTCDHLYQHLLSHRILVRNVSKGPGLSGCLRLTIGSPSENSRVIDCISSCQKIM